MHGITGSAQTKRTENDPKSEHLTIELVNVTKNSTPKPAYFVRNLASFDLIYPNIHTNSPGVSNDNILWGTKAFFGSFTTYIEKFNVFKKGGLALNPKYKNFNTELQKLYRADPNEYIKNRNIEISLFTQIEKPEELLDKFEKSAFTRDDLASIINNVYLDNKHIGGNQIDHNVLEKFIETLETINEEDFKRMAKNMFKSEEDIESLCKPMLAKYPKLISETNLTKMAKLIINDLPYLLEYSTMYQGINITENAVLLNEKPIIDILFDKAHDKFELSLRGGLDEKQLEKALSVMIEEIYKRATIGGSANVKVSIETKPSLLLEGVYRLCLKGASISNMNEIITKLQATITDTNIFDPSEEKKKKEFIDLLEKLQSISKSNFYAGMNHRDKLDQNEIQLMNDVLGRTHGNFSDKLSGADPKKEATVTINGSNHEETATLTVGGRGPSSTP